MHKLIDNGVHVFEEAHSQFLIQEAKKILDVDKQKQLAKDLNSIF